MPMHQANLDHIITVCILTLHQITLFAVLFFLSNCLQCGDLWPGGGCVLQVFFLVNSVIFLVIVHTHISDASSLSQHDSILLRYQDPSWGRAFISSPHGPRPQCGPNSHPL